MMFLGVDNLVNTNSLVALGMASAVAIGTNIKQRRDLMFRGILIGLVQAAGYLLATVLTQTATSAVMLARELLLQVLGGLSSCIVAIGSLPFLENLFGMVTLYRLAELTDSTQPLLRQLEENAPGTYQHSLAVANLAEAGARAIGADVNLVRAGSLYHDIGKMVRPRYFIENQLGDRNPHDGMTPEESRDRVLAHVTDGMALAQKYSLPRVVQDFIPQHQGTTLMAYFYHKACLRDGAQNVDQFFYRYPGPKPQSREAAIVMLADVSEAVTHSLKDPTQGEVESSMSTVFRARWDDGQFSESGLTLEELERVKKAFVRVWRTLHHERLKYPSTTTGKMPIPPETPSTATNLGTS
jgi:putative nucleotidyltransferase with HDIG domain